MEKHIFRFGNSSMGIIVPKKWIGKRGLSAESIVYVSENNKGDLVISAQQRSDRIASETMSRNDYPERIVRFVEVYYMSGVRKLVLNSKDGFTSEQLEALQKKINNECPGFEIVEQISNRINIEDFTNFNDVDLDRILTRLNALVKQEFAELLAGNSGTIDRLEELVDRFYMLGIRYVNIVQPSDVIKYYRAIQLMEMIADNLASLAASHAGPQYMKLMEKLESEFNLALTGFGGDERAIAGAEALRRELRAEIAAMKMDGLKKKLLKEIATFASQIAEFGLLKEKEAPVLF